MFPFMSKGHTIPLLHLSRLLLLHRPHVALTIFTTPSNHQFISSFLSNYNLISSPEISIISLNFPADTPFPGVESTDKLPTMSLLPSFVDSTKLLQPGFEAALSGLSNVKLLISDGFLPWTLDSANKFHIPRLVFYGMNYSLLLVRVAFRTGLFSGSEQDDDPKTVPDFPWIKLSRNHMPYPFNMRDPSGPFLDMITEMGISEASSQGILFNTFHELEKPFIDYWNANCSPRAWSIGPLCWADPEKEAQIRPNWMDWMDEMLVREKQVLYIAFGTQAEVSNEQFNEIAIGLEKSGVNFMWVVRLISPEQEKIIDELMNRLNVEDQIRGLVVRDWVDQRAVLEHKAVYGFLSHCGWNSVTESMCAGVPILAWPMIAEQHFNARMVEEEMEIGIRVETCDGSVRGFVTAEMVEKVVVELIEGIGGEKIRKKTKEMAEVANKVMEEGGSSWLALEDLLHEFHIGKTIEINDHGLTVDLLHTADI